MASKCSDVMTSSRWNSDFYCKTNNIIFIRYNNGQYNHTGTFDQGQHCWDNECHNGTISLCADSRLCNDPSDQHTSSVAPETPGSGLDCNYGWLHHNGSGNLSTAICHKNDTMCITVYHDDGWTFFDCYDPHSQGGQFNQTDVCFDDAIFCEPPHFDHGKGLYEI